MAGARNRSMRRIPKKEKPKNAQERAIEKIKTGRRELLVRAGKAMTKLKIEGKERGEIHKLVQGIMNAGLRKDPKEQKAITIGLKKYLRQIGVGNEEIEDFIRKVLAKG